MSLHVCFDVLPYSLVSLCAYVLHKVNDDE